MWCGTLVRTSDGISHLLYSRWPVSTGHHGWVTHSQIAYATSDDILGPYAFKGVALAGAGGDAWDADVTHNPTVIKHEGRFYLYYMGNRGNGEYWNNRNQQRIGVAVADHPAGPWQRFDRPVIDVTPGSFDGKLVSNPTVTRGPDGRFCMVYKAVSDAGSPPKFGAVVCGVAFADHPLGPFIRQTQPIMVNPENDWSVEDPFVWSQDGQYYCLVKDFQGYFARSDQNVLVLFRSANGIHWQPAADPLFLDRSITWNDGTTQRVDALERPQLLIENGRPVILSVAAAIDPAREQSFNIQFKFDWSSMIQN